MDWIFNTLDFSQGSGLFIATLVVVVLLLSGLGLPVPEDIPLLVAGYLCYSNPNVSIWVMLPVTFAAVLGADFLIYGIGRKYGHHLPRLPLLKKHLTPERLAKAELKLSKHGGKYLFVARFLPGLRAPAYLTAGVCKVPFYKMVVYDGLAALISVPVWVLASYIFGAHIDKVKELAHDTKNVILVLFIVAIVVAVVWWFRHRRKRTVEQTQ